MLDYLIRGATIVDGSGGQATRGDVGIRNGRIEAVGQVDDAAATTFDADGLVVAPGFVDPHTHYDAQLFWDPYATPSSVHGVTSVIGGNCGFTLAPLREADADYTRRMMMRVEGMPLAALEQGVDWKWETFRQYLDALEGRVAVNAAFLVGHCALRRYVMGADAVGATASEAQVTEMVRLLHESIEAGAIGFSTTRSHTHSDGDGEPVASRHASRDELLALCAAVGEHEGATALEGIVSGCLDQFSDDEIDLLVAMTVAAKRPLNWNVLTVDSKTPQRVERQLAASDRAAEAGGRILALTMPVMVPMNMSFLTFCALHLLPGWGDILSQPVPERIVSLSDPGVRQGMLERARSPEAGVVGRLSDFGRYVIGDTYSAANEGLKGRVVADLAGERGKDPFDTLIEVVINDDLRTILWPMATDNDDASWAIRTRVWDDPRVLLGGSDAGAHLDRMCGAPYTTRFLGDMLRGRKLMSLERAVQLLTDAPARVFGLAGRGRLTPGFHADVVVFDPNEIGSADATLVRDLPGGSARLTADARGVVRVLVNGVETVTDGSLTGATAGQVLRSGRDTEPVHT